MSPAPPLLGVLLLPVWAEVVAVELVPLAVVVARPVLVGRRAPVTARAVRVVLVAGPLVVVE